MRVLSGLTIAALLTVCASGCMLEEDEYGDLTEDEYGELTGHKGDMSGAYTLEEPGDERLSEASGCEIAAAEAGLDEGVCTADMETKTVHCWNETDCFDCYCSSGGYCTKLCLVDRCCYDTVTHTLECNQVASYEQPC